MKGFIILLLCVFASTSQCITEYLSGFKLGYVGEDGEVRSTRPPIGSWIEVAASPSSSVKAHHLAILIISRQTRLMPHTILRHLARYASVGVFTRQETLTIYPEFKHFKELTKCHGTCTGHCASTCTSDGRKWGTVAGAGGRKAVVLQDNILCTSRDPYDHHSNVLVHEFSHAVQHSLNTTLNNKVKTAYEHARRKGQWSLDSYAMSNYREYFADGAASFFNVNHLLSAGGMNRCGRHTYCDSEAEARAHLRHRDPHLFHLLSYIFTDDRPHLPSHMTMCPNKP